MALQSNVLIFDLKPSLKFKFKTAAASSPVSPGISKATDMSFPLPKHSTSLAAFSKPCPLKPQKKTSPIRSLYGGIVHVKVGANVTGAKMRDFGVHGGLLCQRSKFFDSALNGSSVESSCGIVELPLIDPDVFEIVNCWLYTNKLTEAEKGKDVECSLLYTVEVYIFGQEYGMPMLCNNAIDRLIRHFNEQGNLMTPFLPVVYQRTPANSPLRKLVIACYIRWDGDLTALLNEHSDTILQCPEFLMDLSKVLASRRVKPLPSNVILNMCQYHQHAEGEKKCS